MGIFDFFRRKKLSKQELQLYLNIANQNIKIFQESQKLFQETTNPDVFFSRYDQAIKCLKELQYISNLSNGAIKYSIKDIPGLIIKFESNREKVTNEFITRYFTHSKEKAEKLKTEKGRSNNAKKSYDKLMKHSDKLTDKQIENIKSLWKTININL